MARNWYTTAGVIVLVIVILALLVVLDEILCLRRNFCVSRVVSFPDGQNVLANGSFEDGTQPGGVFQPNQDGVMSLPPDSTTMPGWTALGTKSLNQDVAWLQNANSFVANGATDGTHFLDLTGLHDAPLPDGSFTAVRQTFATAARMPYELSLDIMVSPPRFAGPITVVALISKAPGEQAYAQAECGPFNPTAPGNHSTTCRLRFTAVTASTTLTLVGTAGTHYIGLDRVSVECVAPLGRPGFCS